MNSFKYRDPSSISSKPLNEKLFFYQACILITGSDSIRASSRSRPVQFWAEALRDAPCPAPPALPGLGGPCPDPFWPFLRSPASLPADGAGGGGARFEGIRQACEAGEGRLVRSWGSAKTREEKEGLEFSCPPPPRPRPRLRMCS